MHKVNYKVSKVKIDPNPSFDQLCVFNCILDQVTCWKYSQCTIVTESVGIEEHRSLGFSIDVIAFN